MESARGSSQPLLPEWSATLTTRDGVGLNVRPAAEGDEERVAEFFGQAGPQDLRFRFLSSVSEVGEPLVRSMVAVDHQRTESLLAFDAATDELAATAMVAATPQMDDAEVAVMVRPDLKGKGIGWSMLAHACDYAKERGFQRVHSLEYGDNRSAVALEKEMGFTARPCPDDMALTLLTKELTTD